MSITKSRDHSYYFLQRAKELFETDKKTYGNMNNLSWDRLSQVTRDLYEEDARKREKQNVN